MEDGELKSKKKVNAVGIIFTLIIAVCTVITLFSFADFDETLNEILNADVKYILLALAVFLIYVIIYPLGLSVLTAKKGYGSTFADDYLIGASEHFFNGITPYQTGAQPFQIYSYKRKGVKLCDSTGVIIVNFLALLLASNIFVAVSLIFGGGDFFKPFSESGTLWIPIIGITMNFLVLLLFISVATSKWVRSFFKGAIRLFCKIKFIGKKLEKAIPAFDEYCDNAQRACKEGFGNLKRFIPLVILRLVCLFCYYSIPYFIFKALHIEGYGFIYSLFATAFTVNSVVWIPTPGTSGGIEYAFTTVFGLISADAVASAIIWRGFTYYALLIISALEYLLFEIINKTAKPREKVDGKENE